ncbi:hypothetical protein RY27_25715 [Litorilinea aerophila]|nr:hypothetical protein RY27_25715 [Litorilinea aerophila]
MLGQGRNDALFVLNGRLCRMNQVDHAASCSNEGIGEESIQLQEPVARRHGVVIDIGDNIAPGGSQANIARHT